MIVLRAFIPDTTDCFNVSRSIPQLLTQGFDVHIHRSGTACHIVTPDSRQDLLSGENAIGVLYQQLQQIVFFFVKKQSCPSI